MTYRTDRDSLGDVQVPADKFWGPQTQRSLENFAIGQDVFEPVFIHALALIKVAAAKASVMTGHLSAETGELIDRAAKEVQSGRWDDQFPLKVWQTGSGTQTNMNMNEVIANLANQFAGNPPGSNQPVHPNDHVNFAQSSNDTFPTAMHVATVLQFRRCLLPALESLIQSIDDKCHAFTAVIKIGRTHMMDATPMTLAQEFSGYRAQLNYAKTQLIDAEKNLMALPIGGTAVGTGLNAPPGWSEQVALRIAEITQCPFTSAENKFMAISAHDALAGFSGALKQLANSLLVIGNNLRLLASGPRCGLAEIRLPANEPGSSIMPGKVNPTQIEALTMVAAQVIGNDAAVNVGATQANLQLNVFKPLIIHNILRSLQLLSDAMNSFNAHCVKGIEPNHSAINRHLQQSLMLVTALTPRLGYDKAAEVAKQALDEDKTLLEVILEQKLLSEKEATSLLDPARMLGSD